MGQKLLHAIAEHWPPRPAPEPVYPAYNAAMDFDAALARRMLNNRNIRAAHGWAEDRDIGGALAITSDAPIPALNCLLDFDAREAALDSLLDIGFALLRAFDLGPAVEVTPLSRPTSLPAHLERRLLEVTERQSWMNFEGDERSISTQPGGRSARRRR